MDSYSCTLDKKGDGLVKLLTRLVELITIALAAATVYLLATRFGFDIKNIILGGLLVILAVLIVLMSELDLRRGDIG